jgi:fibronectin-binding autotransporter adhesin
LRGLTIAVVVAAVLGTGSPVWAVSYTAVANGNWSDAATWGGGPPNGTGDDAALSRFAVTLDVSRVIGKVLMNNTTGRLDTAGNTLTVHGGLVFSNGTITGAGEIVVTNSALILRTGGVGTGVPTNAATLTLWGGGDIFGNTASTIPQNDGVINMRSGLVTLGPSRTFPGTGTWNVSSGVVLQITGNLSGGGISGVFNNDGAVTYSNGTSWAFATATTGKGNHGGSFSGNMSNVTFNGTNIFRSGASVQATNVSIYAATREAGSSLNASNLTILNNGSLSSEIPITVYHLTCGTGVRSIGGSGVINCISNFSWQGVWMSGGALTAGTFTVSLSNIATNDKNITVLNGGSFTGSSANVAFSNRSSIALLGGEFVVNVGGSVSRLLVGNGTLYIGPSATLHRVMGTNTLAHQNLTTNAGTIKASTPRINFNGGLVQTATGALRGNGGTLGGTLTINGGQIAPGDADGAAGTLTLAGTNNLSAAAKIGIELGGTTTNDYDRLLGGRFDLNNCSLEVGFINGFQNTVQNSDTFLVVTGAVYGAFGNLSGGRAAVTGGGTFQVNVTTGAGGSVVLADYRPAGARGTVLSIR